MSERTSCPSCGAALEPDAEACPNCPWSLSAPDENSDARPSLPGAGRLRPYLGPALFLAVVGGGIWAICDMWLRLAQEGAQDAISSLPAGAKPLEGIAAELIASDAPLKRGAAAPDSDEPVILAGPPVEPVPAAPKAPAKRAAPRPRAAAPADAEEAAGVLSISGQGVPEAKETREWRLRGRVFDLVTLAPLPGVRITFADHQTNASAQTSTDADGRYKTLLPALQGRGYVVMIEKTGYAPSYAGPETPGVAELDAASRAELARQLARSVEAPATLEPGGEEPLLTNFFLAPAR